MACCCLEGVASLFRAPLDHEEERASFERTVTFLASVPLFRKQLPRSELPKVAQCLTRRVWQPGQKLVCQGETGRAFFLIESGQALVVTAPAPGELQRTRAALCAGDYFGGHTLMTERPNVATIIAGGPGSLVTLSMSRAAFEESNLKRWLHFPKRAAIYEDSPQMGGRAATSNSLDSVSLQTKSTEEEDFIRNVVSRNSNLRALLQASSDKFSSIAAVAERRVVSKGTVVARCGEMGHEFFVIRQGSFNVDLQQDAAIVGGQQSAEETVARSTMAERLMRKQTFLQSLIYSKKIPNADGRRASIAVGALNRKTDDEDEWKSLRHRQSSLKESLTGESLIGAIRSPNSARRTAKQPRQPRTETMEELLRDPAASSGSLEDEAVTLGEGESFGELSLLYNTRREATFTALEDSVIYVVGRKSFRECFSRRGHRFEEYLELLEDVRVLTSLLSSERWELACNALGFVEFRPGERVLTQGKRREARQWYVIASGSCYMLKDQSSDGGAVTTTTLAELRRTEHFGERSLLRGDMSTEVNVDAGPEGMCCLTFDGDMIRDFIEGVFRDSDGITPTVHTSIEEWCAWKGRGWDRQVSTASNRIGSQEGQKVALDSLRRVCLLGRGGYGQVSLVEEGYSQRKYALKTLSKGYIHEQGAGRLVRWERELISMVRSPFVIRLHNTFSDAQCIYFLLEAALGGSLIDVLRSHPEVFREDTPHGSAAAFYVACLTAALEHLHERKIVHRDLKPENALLDERGYAKLCDMGFARFVLGKTNTLAGTPEYMAPEMIDFPHTHDMTVDWWALGVVTFELLAGQTPFEDEGLSDPMGRLLAMRRSQERGSLSFPFHFPHLARGFTMKLLTKLPNRLGATSGAAEVRGHGMFSVLKFDWEAFHDQLLPSPFCQEWSDPNFLCTDDLGMEHGAGYLGLEEGDPLFVRATPEMGFWDF